MDDEYSNIDEEHIELFLANNRNNTKHFIKTSGIYGLVYNFNIFYIGQSTKIGERIRSHISETAIERIKKAQRKEELKGYHYANQNLLKMYNFIETKRDKIFFIILKECDIKDLNNYEEKFISKYKPKFNKSGVNVPFHPAIRKLPDTT